MTAKSHFWIVSFLLCCQTVFVWAQTDPNNWEKLNLNSTTIIGAMVYYEKSFEPNLPFFEEMYKKFLGGEQEQQVLNSKKEKILADINHILGIKEPPAEMQENFLTKLTGTFPSVENMTFYLVKQSTTKDFLRTGGQLPNFTYNKVTDMVAYNPNFTYSNKDKHNKSYELAFPISSNENFEKDTDVIFKILQDLFGKVGMDFAIHEIVEMSMLMYIKQTDPYWRWFSDGFSEAITYELLKKHSGIEHAEEYIKERSIDKFIELEKEINLRYWMSGKFCLLLDDIPTEKGQKINYARYAYATFEARRLIDEHGIDCVREILDEITVKQSRTGSDLIETIKNVTGEDMDARLAAYQSFEQREQGIAKYAIAFNEASKNKDYEHMVFNVFRMHELRLPSEAEQLLSDYRYAGGLLFKMGFEKEADMIMENCMQFFSNPGFINGKRAASEIFILYALECEKPLKAREVAEGLLKTYPDNVPALTIQMCVHLADKQLNEAKELAKKIISHSKNKESRNYKAASAVLAIDPNQPDSRK